MTLRRQLVSYLAVGLINTAVSLGVIALCMDVFGLAPLVANAIGFAVGLAISFALNGRFTFGQRRYSAETIARFLIVFALAYGANAALVLWLTPVNRYAAQIVGMGCYTVLNFVGCRVFVFRER